MAHGDGAAVHVDLVVRHLERSACSAARPRRRLRSARRGRCPSPTCRPASAPSPTPRAGPVSMIVGLRADRGEGADACARLEAGFLAELGLVPSRIAAAPSTMPDELPAWWTWVMLLDLGIALLRHRVEARHHLALHLEADGSSAASVCMVVCGRMSSSRFSSSTPFWSRTGTIEFLNRPAAQAAAARFCDFRRHRRRRRRG
jgi:hypothetical protein